MIKINPIKLKRLAKSRKSLSQIAREFGCSEMTITQRVKQFFEVSLTKLKDEGLLDRMVQVESGLKKLYQVREEEARSPIGFCFALYKLGFLDLAYGEEPLTKDEIEKLRKGMGKYSRPDIDSLIDEGLTLREISKRTVCKDRADANVHHSMVEKYIIGSGQYPYWNKGSVNKSRWAYKGARKKLLSFVTKNILERSVVREEDEDIVKAEKSAAKLLCLARPKFRARLDSERVKNLFLDYYTSLRYGFRRSHDEFAERNGGFFDKYQVRHMFEKLGIPSMKVYKRRGRK